MLIQLESSVSSCLPGHLEMHNGGEQPLGQPNAPSYATRAHWLELNTYLSSPSAAGSELSC